MTRREFVRRTAMSAAAMRVVTQGRMNSAPMRILRVAVILPAGSRVSGVDDVARGAQLAFTETERAGQLFGQRIEMVERRVTSTVGIPDEVRKLGAWHPAAIIGGMDVEECRSIISASVGRRFVFFNIGTPADVLRRTECRDNMFHIAASDAMLSAARAAAGTARIELWHDTLERYGGSQLNDRYRAKFSRGMSSSAWAGWLAVKIAWESSLRATSVDATKILETLDKNGTQFDGHKGTPLSFRAWDHQLREPLYAIGGVAGAETVIAELPDAGRNGEQPIRDLLDRFGDTAQQSNCLRRTGE